MGIRSRFTVEEAKRIAEYTLGDGHTIYAADELIRNLGATVDSAKIEQLVRTFHSGNTEQSSIYVKGQRVAFFRGVNALDLIEQAAIDIGCKLNTTINGRGSRARDAYRLIVDQ